VACPAQVAHRLRAARPGGRPGARHHRRGQAGV